MSYIQYWDVNNLYRWAMSQKHPVNKFEWIKYDEEYFLEVDVQYLKILHQIRNDLPFLPERIKIGKSKSL